MNQHSFLFYNNRKLVRELSWCFKLQLGQLITVVNLLNTLVSPVNWAWNFSLHLFMTSFSSKNIRGFRVSFFLTRALVKSIPFFWRSCSQCPGAPGTLSCCCSQLRCCSGSGGIAAEIWNVIFKIWYFLANLQSRGTVTDGLRRVPQRSAGLVFPLGGDHLGPGLPGGLSLRRHGPL